VYRVRVLEPGQDFVGLDDKTLSVAICLNDLDRSLFAIHCCYQPTLEPAS
jgi:hypothetical protein